LIETGAGSATNREVFLPNEYPDETIERDAVKEFYVKPGQEVSFSKTVGESDVYMFAGITGDLSSNHVNEQVMSRTKYKRRIAHGALIIGYMSTASTRMVELNAGFNNSETAVSLGYDKIRFLGPVFLGDTVTVTYMIKKIDIERRRSYSEIMVINQDGSLVAVGQHILKWVPNENSDTDH
jgi:3-hydroxybutyryl-CoA dehydratase